jgi:hypothetical protein
MHESAVGLAFVVVMLQTGAIAGILLVASFWRIFEKAHKPGPLALVPIYQFYVMIEIAGKPGWWLLLFFIPIVNIVIAWKVCAALAIRFGRGRGVALGLLLLPVIFFPVLAVCDAFCFPAAVGASGDQGVAGRRDALVVAILSCLFVGVTCAITASLAGASASSPAPGTSLGATEGLAIAALIGLIAMTQWRRWGALLFFAAELGLLAVWQLAMRSPATPVSATLMTWFFASSALLLVLVAWPLRTAWPRFR